MKHITQLQVLFANEPLGMLSLYNRQYWFQYDAHWLQQGFDLAPQMMDFNLKPQLPKQPIFQGLHGVFNDSLPDGWGLLLMDRFFKRQFNWDYHEVTPLDRLAYLGKRAMGALEYEPVMVQEEVSEAVDLMTLAQDAQRLLAGKTRAVLNQLRILGGSPGGARPKVTIGLANDSDLCVAGVVALPANFSHWLVKFRGERDPKDAGRIEKAYAELASAAGIAMPATKLLCVQQARQQETFFATQRFDRDGDKKRHMLTLSSYLYADHRVPSLDYTALLAATTLLAKDIREVKRAFRLMVFNIAMHNKDDHAKNFAFLHDRDNGWKLAPGYDLTFSSGVNNQHTTAINGNGNPTRKDIQVIADEYNVHDWEEIVEEVLTVTTRWQKLAKKYQVTKQSTDRIAKALNEIKKRLV